MAKKIFTYRGKKMDEIKGLSLKEFMEMIPSRQRRSLKRGFTEAQKSLLKRVKKGDENIKTHCRNLIIMPEMVGKTFLVFNGKTYEAVRVEEDMIGHLLGEFALTRKGVTHSSPGIGATKSSSSLSVK